MTISIANAVAIFKNEHPERGRKPSIRISLTPRVDAFKNEHPERGRKLRELIVNAHPIWYLRTSTPKGDGNKFDRQFNHLMFFII